MKVRIKRGDLVESPVVISGVVTLVVYDEFDQPLAVYHQTDRLGVWTTTCDELDFRKKLDELGFASREARQVAVGDLIPPKADPPGR
jgi:hypothetical protein